MQAGVSPVLSEYVASLFQDVLDLHTKHVDVRGQLFCEVVRKFVYSVRSGVTTIPQTGEEHLRGNKGNITCNFILPSPNYLCGINFRWNVVGIVLKHRKLSAIKK